jgi:hypothetical protein
MSHTFKINDGHEGSFSCSAFSVRGVNVTLNQISQLRERSRSSETESNDDIAQNYTDLTNSSEGADIILSPHKIKLKYNGCFHILYLEQRFQT